MKIVAIQFLRAEQGEAEPPILASAFDLNSFSYFKRSTVRDMINFFSRTFIKRTPKGQRQSIQHEEYNCHVYVRQDGLAGIVVCDQEYPPRVAFALMNKFLEEFHKETNGEWRTSPNAANPDWAPLVKALEDYQDPSKADKISAIQKELDETTAVLSKTIDSVLERGEKLDDLVQKSQDLSSQSKVFYKQAKKTNSCCVLM
ncbi:hypothetical protein H310_02832 [Aphanomyces invadans]|uniref:Uncharacterized protein n=1 Tax=Aphanomyces invadans TaxID=157072 RepID=A0A024UJL4_9STRA|nr:hypothetical protein H310_02832 [Aphanomyces invadans]ETW06641.1 hypothetical protein H310_02832 [Aphanomyces invadans]|eukprot:XP_008864716.1 hypothetical protein H310_02832 [Aphanomyces invadans]